MLSEHQRAMFEFSGILKVNSLLSEQAISRARNAILSRFEALGLSRHGEWQLDDRPKAKWPDKGYSAKAIGNKIGEVERLIQAPGIKPIVDIFLEHAALDIQMFKRPQILVTLPNGGSWFMPNDGWHVDFPRLANGQRAGVQIFILLSEIESQGGATFVVAGSHRLLNDGRFIRSSDVTKQLKNESFFQRLMLAPSSSIDDFQLSKDMNHCAQRVDLGVVELTGHPGDVYFMDMRVLHSASPNASNQPRIMATHRFIRADAISRPD